MKNLIVLDLGELSGFARDLIVFGVVQELLKENFKWIIEPDLKLKKSIRYIIIDPNLLVKYIVYLTDEEIAKKCFSKYYPKVKSKKFNAATQIDEFFICLDKSFSK